MDARPPTRSERPTPARTRPDPDDVRRAVLAALCRFFDDDSLAPDDDGDVPIPLGGIRGYVQVTGKPLVVRIFCRLAGDVAHTEALLLGLHRMNATIPLGRFVLSERSVFAVVEIPGAPFIPEHLEEAWAVASAVVQRYADEVKALAHGTVLAR